MHPRNIAARNEAARCRITTAAGELAADLGVPTLDVVTPIEQRDRDVAQMRELECVADLLDSVVAALKEEAING